MTLPQPRAPADAAGSTRPLLRPAPTSLDCLRCQLLGRRRLLCAKEDECRSVPHAFWVGPALLAGWAATALWFVLAYR
jgi:hypothetical protein